MKPKFQGVAREEGVSERDSQSSKAKRLGVSERTLGEGKRTNLNKLKKKLLETFKGVKR